MKRNEIYPTVENLMEIESNRLRIMEARDTDNGILFVVGESSSRKCDIRISEENLEQGVAANSLEDGGRIKEKCLRDGERYIQSKEYHTVATANLTDKTKIDLQLYNPITEKHLALTAFTRSIRTQKQFRLPTRNGTNPLTFRGSRMINSRKNAGIYNTCNISTYLF